MTKIKEWGNFFSKFIINKPRNNKINWAYVAGWIDGDGWFTIPEKGNSGTIGIELIDKNVVEYMAKAFGSEVKFRDRHRPDSGIKKLKRIYYTHVHADKAAEAAAKFYPFLMEKTAKAKELMRRRNVKIPKSNYLDFNDQQFLDYLTAFFEAEGCILIRKKSFHLQFTNTNKSLIYLLKRLSKNLLGMYSSKIIFQRRAHKKSANLKRKDGTSCSQKDIYSLTFLNLTAAPLIQNVLTRGLCKRKIERCAEAFKYIQNSFFNIMTKKKNYHMLLPKGF